MRQHLPGPLRGFLVGVVSLMVLTGCVAMPSSGPVVEADDELTASAEPGIAIAPRPPDPGASPTEVVQGFLDAMRATPLQTSVAAEYVASDARSAWDPGQELITYDERTAGERVPQVGGGSVTVELGGAEHLDESGRWLGELRASDREVRFPMTQEDGEWRISEPPDALVVPNWWFDSRYAQVSLYFFDPTGKILVPEPVFVARGSSFATELVRGLARGPESGLTGVERSFLPEGVSEGLSVPVSADGVADVALSNVGPRPSTADIAMMSAQLAWTLRQDPSVSAIRLTIDGEPVQLPGGGTELEVGSMPKVDPAGYQPSQSLFGRQDGILVSGSGAEFQPVEGALGQVEQDWRSFAVDLPGETGAGVSADGTALQTGPVNADGDLTTLISGATNLLRPAWDAHGRLWVVDRTRGGAEISYAARGQRHPVRVPGMTGTDARAMLVSRDGSRLVLVVRRAGADRVLVSRLRANAGGEIVGATRAQVISRPSDGVTQVRDLAWLSPTSVLVLHPLGNGAQVQTLSVDGAHSGFDTISVTLPTQAEGLASSPVAASAHFAVTAEGLHGLTSDDPDWPPSQAQHLDYVG